MITLDGVLCLSHSVYSNIGKLLISLLRTRHLARLGELIIQHPESLSISEVNSSIEIKHLRYIELANGRDAMR